MATLAERIKALQAKQAKVDAKTAAKKALETAKANYKKVCNK